MDKVLTVAMLMIPAGSKYWSSTGSCRAHQDPNLLLAQKTRLGEASTTMPLDTFCVQLTMTGTIPSK